MKHHIKNIKILLDGLEEREMHIAEKAGDIIFDYVEDNNLNDNEANLLIDAIEKDEGLSFGVGV